MTAEDIASALDKRRGTVKRTLSRLLKAKRTTWKHYRVSDENRPRRGRPAAAGAGVKVAHVSDPPIYPHVPRSPMSLMSLMSLMSHIYSLTHT